MYSAAHAPLRTPFFGCVKRHLISDWRLAETRLWPSTTVRTAADNLIANYRLSALRGWRTSSISGFGSSGAYLTGSPLPSR
ncbi:unnamed protein product [Fusarium graminearum]|uniref:Chromosome 1, complete genome n=1 Tax=Gibberella zeae (strain ATCC MYA-4620 / CBS 123657 / FGSC 9075 / NRRL 31084 / PH-1) TaxID=229533 RepID=A0A0E0RVL9_GIBZE|nr:hypothetical protein FG05_30346 [Fusarium graminearum]CEF75294.1 unnamed protein product [Fusarium graminearum]CZS78574.1 unnamed protein product [Fusarium graminearum]